MDQITQSQIIGDYYEMKTVIGKALLFRVMDKHYTVHSSP